MPPEVEYAFEQVDQEVIRLHSDWKIFLELFGGKERVELLNETAPYYFVVTQAALVDSIILAACRLTDPAETRGGQDENLTIERLIDLVSDDLDDQPIASKLREQKHEIERRAEPLRNLRNKSLAHNDLAVVMEEELLPNVSRSEIDELLNAFGKLMNTVSGYYSDPETLYGEAEHLDGTKSLLAYLQMGLESESPKTLRSRRV